MTAIEWHKGYNGLFGWVYGGTVQNLTVYGEIDSPLNHQCRGIVGEVGSNGTIRNCSFYGSVTGSRSVGGVIGRMFGNGTIENCYFNGKVKATGVSAEDAQIEYFPYECGGVIGGLELTEDATVKVVNCYAVSNSTCNGGVIGYISKTGEANISISGNYSLKTMAEKAVNGEYTDGCKPISQSMMQSLDEILGTPYVHNDNYALNDGYPVFEWQYIKPASGDVNDDGNLDVKDVIALQKWILSVKNAKLTNVLAADLNGDGLIDVFDLGLLKQKLIVTVKQLAFREKGTSRGTTPRLAIIN